jgi:hypothetical protein
MFALSYSQELIRLRWLQRPRIETSRAKRESVQMVMARSIIRPPVQCPEAFSDGLQRSALKTLPAVAVPLVMDPKALFLFLACWAQAARGKRFTRPSHDLHILSLRGRENTTGWSLTRAV